VLAGPSVLAHCHRRAVIGDIGCARIALHTTFSIAFVSKVAFARDVAHRRCARSISVAATMILKAVIGDHTCQFRIAGVVVAVIANTALLCETNRLAL
jgi:hypothetical protein